MLYCEMLIISKSSAEQLGVLCKSFLHRKHLQFTSSSFQSDSRHTQYTLDLYINCGTIRSLQVLIIAPHSDLNVAHYIYFNNTRMCTHTRKVYNELYNDLQQTTYLTLLQLSVLFFYCLSSKFTTEQGLLSSTGKVSVY